MVHIKKKTKKKTPYSEFLISGPEIGPRNMHFIQEPDNADITNAGPHF